MPSSTKSDAPKALDSLRRLRSRLEVDHSAFRAASQIEGRAQLFLKSVKAELKTRRKQIEWDQAKLAEAMEYSQSAISKIEGDGDLSLRTLFRLAHALGMHPVITFVMSPQGIEQTAETDSASDHARASAAAIEAAQEKALRQMSSAMSEAMTDIARISAPEDERVLEAS